MTLTQKRFITLLIVILAGAVPGRLAVRAALNLLIGGTLFGGEFPMIKEQTKRKGRVKWAVIYIGAFLAAFAASALFKMTYSPLSGLTRVDWNDSIGRVYTDLPYGDGPANKFDLYVPADNTRQTYGLVVYLHAGSFTAGDKSGDAEILQWLCAKGYVAAGINYTLTSEENPQANIYTQSVDIRDSIPFVVAEAEKLGYHLDRMAVAGGSAGHCLAMLYAYRDAPTSPLPVKLVFGAVGPSSFYPEDWGVFGFDQNPDAAAVMFSVMSGKPVTPDLFGTPAYGEIIKDISAVSWIDETSVPSLLAYGAHDKVQPFDASKRLDATLTQYGVPHDYIVFPHSGHGLQNDDRQARLYYEKINEYLEQYLN